MEPWEMRDCHAEFLDACNRHDLLAIREFVAPGVRRAHLAGGADAWLDDLADLFHGFPDWRWKRIQAIAEDDRLAVHVRGSGTHLGMFRGLAPSRRRVNVAEFAMYRLTGVQISEASGSGDAELLAQLRAEPPASGARAWRG